VERYYTDTMMLDRSRKVYENAFAHSPLEASWQA
jgi:hypothetical protein